MIDKELDVLLPFLSEDISTEENPDAFDKIISASPLAAFVGHDQADRFARSTQALDARVREHYKKLAASVTTKNPPAGVPASDTLEKNFNPKTRRKENLRAFYKRSRAGGESEEEIISYAAKHDAETANILRAIASEEAA